MAVLVPCCPSQLCDRGQVPSVSEPLFLLLGNEDPQKARPSTCDIRCQTLLLSWSSSLSLRHHPITFRKHTPGTSWAFNPEVTGIQAFRMAQGLGRGTGSNSVLNHTES